MSTIDPDRVGAAVLLGNPQQTVILKRSEEPYDLPSEPRSCDQDHRSALAYCQEGLSEPDQIAGWLLHGASDILTT
jgi:hypothetical protein